MHRSQRGTTLIETLVAAAVFVVFSVAIYELYAKLSEVATRIRVKTIATQITSEKMEFIRNLQYTNVGTVSGIPSGLVPQTETIVRNGITFGVTTTIRNIDYPADGTLGGTPNDLSPADNKLVTISVSCTSCRTPVVTEYTSAVAPKGLETENGNGALVIKTIDANGAPVANATVTIQNTALSPQVSITDTTDTNGVLTIVDAPPSTEEYKITVTKSGYSTDRTHTPGDTENPNPVKPHLTVAENTVTQATFAIDQTATISLALRTPQCSVVDGVSGNLFGAKLIGTTPDVKKITIPFSVTGATQLLTGVEWDTYTPVVSGASYDIAGTNPVFPLSVAPGSNPEVTLTLVPAANNRLVVAVVDAGGLPVAGATVSVDGSSSYVGQTSIGSVAQTDWSGGGGQTLFADQTKFASSDGNIVYSTLGALSLLESGGLYVSDGILVSSTIDFGAATTFQQLSWLPATQPVGVGVNAVRFQIATNTDGETWNFVGPDGTDQTYYTTNNVDIADIHNGDQYFRYKLLLSTLDTSKTPSISDIGVTYSSGCLPPGQIDFGGLPDGAYTLTVEKNGYTTAVKDITINDDAYETVIITP